MYIYRNVFLKLRILSLIILKLYFIIILLYSLCFKANVLLFEKGRSEFFFSNLLSNYNTIRLIVKLKFIINSI